MKLSAASKSAGLVTFDGILSAESEDDLKRVFAAAVQQGMTEIILDFRPLDHMNSAGASVLTKLALSAKQKRMKLLAFGLNKRYQEIFNMTGLSESIPIVRDTSDRTGGFPQAELRQLQEMSIGKGRQDDNGWAPNFVRLRVREKPEGAINRNVDKRRVVGPLQGFGPMWQKTYLLTINKAGSQPHDVIATMKQRFPEFQPPTNRFYPSSKGIAAGEVVLIDSSTPGGIVSTGVLVLYADDLSFTLMTPQGHPEAGWVTFSARNRADAIEMQIQGLARAADPLYELAFRIAGSKFQETIWKHVLSSLASVLGVNPNIQIIKTCVAPDLQWLKTGNIWYNAQIRSLPYNIPHLFRRPRKRSQ